MYITQVEMDIFDRKKMKELSHVAAVHNWVEQAFPDEISSGNRSRKLWRIDAINGRQYLLVTSESSPDLDLLNRYGVPGSAQTKEYSPFLQKLKAGQKVRFKITVNPVEAIQEEKGQRGRVKPHVTISQQKKFLMDRSVSNGFRLREDEFEVTERSYVPLIKRGQRIVNLSKVTCEGLLTIADADEFRKTLIQGIGKKKAYGFGLLTVMPMESYE